MFLISPSGQHPSHCKKCCPNLEHIVMYLLDIILYKKLCPLDFVKKNVHLLEKGLIFEITDFFFAASDLVSTTGAPLCIWHATPRPPPLRHARLRRHRKSDAHHDPPSRPHTLATQPVSKIHYRRSFQDLSPESHQLLQDLRNGHPCLTPKPDPAERNPPQEVQRGLRTGIGQLHPELRNEQSGM